MLTYKVYFEDHYWWFEVVDVDPLKGNAVIQTHFRRRCESKEQAEAVGREAREHIKNLRRERWAATNEV